MFWKKKKMIDISRLHKRGIKIPKTSETITNKEGFVEVPNSSSMSSSSFVSSPQSADSYDKREIDEKIERLDNLIYKLEQRIELLERKLGVDDSTPKINW